MANLRVAFDFAMELEGGGQVHTVPGDPGGTTKWGISQRANPDLDIPNLTREDAIAIYQERYWDPRFLGELQAQSIANELFEFTINADPAFSRRGKAILVAQKSYNDLVPALEDARGCFDHPPAEIVEDGIMGPQTLGALNSLAHIELATVAFTGRFNIHQLDYYRRLRRDLVERFLLGWIRRVIA